MAIIREKSQFKIGRIGVTRSSDAGSIVAESVQGAANEMANLFYRKAAKQAEEKGIEAAAETSREEIISINPKTGEPEALPAPSEFGSIASDSYKKIIDTRFQQSIEEEIQNKAKELAVRYEASPNSVGLYETAMSDYIASMSNAAEGKYKTYIADVGASYLNSTRTNLAVAQVRRERLAAKKASEKALENGLNDVELLVSQKGPTALQGPTVTNGIIQSVSAGNTDALNAGLYGAEKGKSYDSKLQLSITKGLIRYAAQKVDDPETLTLLQQAIGTQNADAVPSEFPEIAEALRGFGSDYTGLADLEKFSDGLLSDRIVAANIFQEREIAEQESENAQVLFDLQQNKAGETLAAKAFSQKRGPLATVNRSARDYERLTIKARNQLVAGNKDISDEILAQRDAVIDAQATGLYARALSGLSTAETDSLENAIVNRNLSLAPESARLELASLFRMEAKTGRPVVEGFMSEISAYRSSAGKDIDSMRQVAAAQEALSVNLSSILFSDDVGKTLEERVSEINAIANLGDTERDGMLSSAYLNAGVNTLNTFFADANLTKDQLREAKSVFNAGSYQTNVLSESQVKRINQARAYAVEAGKLSELRTTFNSQTETVTKRINAQQKANEISLQKTSIMIGQASPDSQSDREVYEQMLSESFANGQDISRLWGTTESMTSPVALGILNDITQKGVLPESLHNTFTSLAQGEFRVGDPNALLSHYMNVRDYQFEGQKIRNPAINSLDAGEIAMLDYLADVVSIEGNISADRMAAIYKQKAEFDRDPAKADKIEAALGQPLNDFILSIDGMDEAPLSAVNAMTSATLSLVSLGASPRKINKEIKKQMERTYPDGQGYVVNPNGGNRTQHAISNVAQGNEDIFKNFVRDTVSQSTTLRDFSFGGVTVFSDRSIPMIEQTAIIAEDTIYLQPFNASSNGEVQFLVKRVLPREEGGSEVVNGTIAYGETMVTAPLIISNKDPRFLELAQQAQLRKESQALKIANEAEAFSGTGEGSFLGTIFGTDN